MAGTIKIRAKDKGDFVELKALMNHVMETGNRKDGETGELVPAHFIQEVLVAVNGELVVRAHWGPGVSKNPYLSVAFRGASKGDTVQVSWVDNNGESASQEAVVQ